MIHKTPEQLIAFETRIKSAWERGELPYLLHLGGGNEKELVRIFQDVKPGDWVLASHRCHFHALLKGMSEARLEKFIRDGRSMFVYDRSIQFLCSAILGGVCSIAAGIAWALKEQKSDSRVLCFLGDGGEENGRLYEAALFVEAHQLPCTFIIEDNNRQVDTTVAERRNEITWGLEKVFACVSRYSYAPTYPHAGSGCNFKIEFDQNLVRKHLEQPWHKS